MLKTVPSKKNKGLVFCAISGGVDSSVAALLLKKQGYDVTGIFMRCYNLDGCAERDAEDARRVAEHIGIPFYIFDFEEEYKKQVVEYMVEGYRAGITPNPDVMCNKEIKFGLFLKKALALGANYVATGHYIRLRRNFEINSKFKIQNSKFTLWQAKDLNKDQSYFLWTLIQEQLEYCLFPIGDYLKSEVREMARKAGLPTAEKKDSQGICFLGKVGVRDFLKNYIKPKKGVVLDAEGRKIGEHDGAQFYTIGQRHLGIRNQESGIRGRHETKPYYVVDKNIKTNTIVVAEGENNSALFQKKIEIKNVNFINLEHTNILENVGMSGMSVFARMRYRQPLSSAKIYNLKSKTYNLVFDEPQKFVAPGQSAVFYSAREEMLGGGVIN